MEIGDKAWTWNNWYDLVQIEVYSIENMDGTNIVNNSIPLDNLSYIREAAEVKMRAFIRKQIEIKRNEIFHLEVRLIKKG